MTKRKLLLIGALEVIVLLLGVYFEPTLGVRGHLHGEAFFDGKSTSWWRQELGRWEINGDTTHYVGEGHLALVVWKMPILARRDSWFEQLQQRMRPREEPAGLLFRSPKLLQEDDAAIPVLRELLDDPAPEIRNLAQIGLGVHPDYPRNKGKRLANVIKIITDGGEVP